MRSSDVVYAYVSKLTHYSFFRRPFPSFLRTQVPNPPLSHSCRPAVGPLKPSPAAQPYLSGLNRLVNRLSRVDTA